jgi:hypothetical protein
MIGRRQFLIRAGSLAGLPFFFSISSLRSATESPSNDKPAFEAFASSCIDLGSYVAKTRELTVRFTGRKLDRFYRYSNVPPEVWEKLRALDKSGGVGGYFNETVVQQPKLFPFEVLIIHEFKVNKSVGTKKVKKQKAGDSK